MEKVINDCSGTQANRTHFFSAFYSLVLGHKPASAINKIVINILMKHLKAAGAFKNNNNNLKLTWALGQMGLILRNKGLLDEALKNYKEMLPLIEKTCNLADKARTYLELGNIYIEKENTAEAIKSAEMALAIFKNISGFTHISPRSSPLKTSPWNISTPMPGTRRANSPGGNTISPLKCKTPSILIPSGFRKPLKAV